MGPPSEVPPSLSPGDPALLAIPRQERKREQRDRLREISAELDRIWEKLQERATQLPR